MVLLTGVFLVVFGVFAGAAGFLIGFSSTSLSSMLELADSLDALLAGFAACWPFFYSKSKRVVYKSLVHKDCQQI